jgi:hypothetical protein
MRRVVIESPYGSDDDQIVERNLRFLRACMRDAIVNHDEAPYASHGLYTQPGVLDDRIPVERERGIQAGFLWRDVADATVVYTNLGITKGMQYGIAHAEGRGIPIEYRVLDSWAELSVINGGLAE